MSDKQYNDGYDAFINGEVLDGTVLKSKHPLFRRGYRAAQQEASHKLTSGFPSVLFNIPKKEKTTKYNPTWDDIVSASRRPRFSRLHKKELEPILLMMMRAVDQKKDKIKSYSDVTRMMDRAFDIVLQYGYDQKILNDVDLKQYQYIPK